MLKAKKTAVVLACLAPLLASCVSGPGEKPRDPPPRIADGKDGRHWKHPGSFGSVPDELKERGDAACRGTDYDHASGYHPDARDYDDNHIPGGGFYCAGQVDQEKEDRRKPAAIPPRIIDTDAGRTWDHPAAFGAIPKELKETGKQICLEGDFLRATGYHPRAIDYYGDPIPGGGFFCVGHAEDRKPGPIPPRIILGKDGRVWDNPAAFGSVPKDLKAKGDAVCRKDRFERATGYHPRARDLNGRPIPGGGYFCVDPMPAPAAPRKRPGRRQR
ncbi:hypothetical protein [uncultured Thiodictyon sp.]|uniref:hypothetical protein n=1 Tax=uncultured Thiodictyon sp. TaxID=1846217 RepID=UPI0025DEC504|nr:hypothetical protein [uncultured Thiodictyon sp.]